LFAKAGGDCAVVTSSVDDARGRPSACGAPTAASAAAAAVIDEQQENSGASVAAVAATNMKLFTNFG